MTNKLTQMFPRREGDQIIHHRWQVDLTTAVRLARFSSCTPTRLVKEISEMGTHLPRWVLTISRGRNRLRCSHCGGTLVFDRGLRCAMCEATLPPSRVPSETHLSWFGLLPPVGIASLSRIKKALSHKTPPGHLVGRDERIGSYLLVPLVASYPTAFPAQAPKVMYQSGFFSIRGMPKDTTSHAYHLYGSGVMCLFASQEWQRQMTCRQVIQQRAYAHVIKLLNYADGKSRAFAKVS